MSAPSSSERDRLAERLVVELGAAFHQRVIYPSSHPQVKRSIDRTVEALEAWCSGLALDEASLIRLEDQLLVDRVPLPEDATWRRGLLQALARFSLSGLTLARGLDAVELSRFLDACCDGQTPHASRHLQFGRAAYFDSSGEAAVEAPRVEGGAGIAPEALAAARGELDGIARGATTRVEQLRALVARLARVAAPARIDFGLAESATVADQAFRHGLAVALGALRLGRRLGIDGEALEELGLGGLFHDLGYLEPRPAGETAAERRLQHPLRGAARLARLEGIPDGVVITAYEHHLRFDGAESYPKLPRPRRPSAPARVVAVADTWATLRVRAALAPLEAAEILAARAGSFLDPELVEAFVFGLVVERQGVRG